MNKGAQCIQFKTECVGYRNDFVVNWWNRKESWIYSAKSQKWVVLVMNDLEMIWGKKSTGKKFTSKVKGEE